MSVQVNGYRTLLGSALATLLIVGMLAAGSQPAWGAPLRVAVISDLNGSYGNTRYDRQVHAAVSAIVARRPDLVISTGDMVGGQQLRPLLTNAELRSMWAAFHDVVTAPLEAAAIPLAITPGNHDASAYPTFERERERFGEEWARHRPAVSFVDESRYPFQYAFSSRDVLFIALDVTRVGRLEPDQRRWLDELLTRVGPGFRHRVVFSHLPIHPFTHGRETEVSGDLELERLLVRHDVELYLSGHHHAFYPGYHGGIRYVSQACLGGGPRALIGTNTRSERAVTFLEFDAQGIRIEALTGPGLGRRVDWERLPRSIKGGAVELVRDDLRPGVQGVAEGPAQMTPMENNE